MIRLLVFLWCALLLLRGAEPHPPRGLTTPRRHRPRLLGLMLFIGPAFVAVELTPRRGRMVWGLA